MNNSKSSNKILETAYFLFIKSLKVLGKIIIIIIMFLFYFLIILSITSIFKIIGKDILNLKFNNKNKTYWKERVKKTINMKRQF